MDDEEKENHLILDNKRSSIVSSNTAFRPIQKELPLGEQNQQVRIQRLRQQLLEKI